MSEKKGSWFSRLFKSDKKVEEAPKVEEVVENVVEEPGATDDIAVESAALVEMVQQETIAEVEKEEVLEAVAESVVEEKVAQHDALIESVPEEIAEVKQTEDDIEELLVKKNVAEEPKAPELKEEISEQAAILEETVVEPVIALQENHKETIAEIEQEEILEAVAESVVEEKIEQQEVAIESVPETIEDVKSVEENIEAAIEEPVFTEVHQEKPKTGFFARLKERLGKTRDGITSGLADLFVGKKQIDDDILEELETRLLMADVGVEVTQKLIKNITEEVSRKNLSNVDELLALLNREMVEILKPVEQPLIANNDEHQTYVILMVGVNGVGKTTTIGKLAKKFQMEGKSVMLAAGDTFRAAAVEQLKVWGERNNVSVVAQKEGSDPASVIFDAMESARARKVDVLIADTAGRLHTQAGLMQELAKIHRVMKRVDETAPHEVMLVVDASTGQNALNQATQFNEIVPLSGITFTKLDGTAKGGIIFAIADKLKIPVRFIGVGEAIEDLRPFEAESFVSAIVDQANSPK
ncbi:signal recognition particle-docking protein FtsY [Wohlfahrtiimonas larvae]|uniref:Signal recognition particle receptor FtsY n=1 Tax=Wohlfahrtiimonas larvae TaxID=1157986 RepID=A0ABP9N3A2_9GAMM|nr:signal recognition particle-docking protein FtsY [Wohlfahrtiimonas larvae]